MIQLNLPEYSFKVKKVDKQSYQIFCTTRKKWVALLPEEWVRQNFIQFLITEKNYPKGLFACEYPLQYNGLTKRGDIVVFNTEMNPILLVECKAPSVEITEDAFLQAGRYNVELKLKNLIVTNGLQHFSCEVDVATASLNYLENIPEYEELS